MADYSDRSLELADQLRAAALKNLGRSSGPYRSAIEGEFDSKPPAQPRPRTASSEKRSGKTSR